jgi:hypothetical protein
MAVHFNQSSQFADVRSQIEQHLYDSVLEIEKNVELALRSVIQFNEAIDRLMDTLEQMYQSSEPKDSTGEKSFPIREGRYRVFFKVLIRSKTDCEIVFLDIDDNKQSNLDRFPTHQQIEFDHED